MTKRLFFLWFQFVKWGKKQVLCLEKCILKICKKKSLCTCLFSFFPPPHACFGDFLDLLCCSNVFVSLMQVIMCLFLLLVVLRRNFLWYRHELKSRHPFHHVKHSLPIFNIFPIVLKYICSVSHEDDQTSVLLSQGTFSWEGPKGGEEGDTGSRAAKGSLLLHNLNLHVTKVHTIVWNLLFTHCCLALCFLTEFSCRCCTARTPCLCKTQDSKMQQNRSETDSKHSHRMKCCFFAYNLRHN